MRTNRLRRAAALLLILGPSLQSCTFAVAQSEDKTVLHTVIAFLRERLPPPPVALDPRILSRNVFHGPDQWRDHRDPAITRELARALGASVGTFDELLVCGDTIQGVIPCHLTPVETLVILSAPEIRGNTATVQASIWTNQELLRTGFEGRKNAEVMDVLLTLTRDRGIWKVTAEKVLRMS